MKTIQQNMKDLSKAIKQRLDTVDRSDKWRFGSLWEFSKVFGMWVDQNAHITIKPGESLYHKCHENQGIIAVIDR